MKRLIVGLILVAGFGLGQQKEEVNSVLVRITTDGLKLSHSRIRPGRVTFLVENMTPLSTASLDVVPVGNNGVRGLAAKLSENVMSRKSKPQMVLTPGTYRLSLVNVPNTEVEITVAEK